MGKFFSDCLGVEEGIAKSDACLMEHVVSGETIDRMIKFMEYVKSDARTGRKLLNGFQSFARRKRSRS